ncbi:GspE/PulE family protein [Neptunomonas sp.]|uniref:GspE/PulE family protein n=1 Tax=Neptunomonas sp. TaxID=1971898 RepID=UPI0025D0E22F|nr:GspE/PulE family protein [Neptunomonas sp.]
MRVNDNTLINAAVQVGLVDANTLPNLKMLSRRQQLPLLELICKEGLFPQTALYRALAESRNLAFYEREDIQVNAPHLNALNAQILLKRLFIPVDMGEQLVVLSSDPDDKVAQDITQRALNKPCVLALANPLLIEALLREHYQEHISSFNAVSIFNEIMKEAYLRQATDLHFEALKTGMQLRMRVDGRLQHYDRPIDKALADSLMSRIKVLAGLDIAEQNMAQDGGFAYDIEGWVDTAPVELRVATLPTRFGERATLRILGQGTTNATLSQLGLPQHLLQPMLEAIHRPYGMVLVSGPTGSGKSTTLYASLRELDAARFNIMTIEDPIEQVIEGISQVQVADKVSFSKALRSFLRHDPDVMLVGEIRDGETAETAVRAAMTGHMVLSTLHTNNAIAAVNRLIDIGCPSYLIASTLLGVLAQRLLRRICQHCCYTYPATENDKKLLATNSTTLLLSKGKGCSHCMGSGYSGRVGIYETLWMDNQLEQLIHQGASEQKMSDYAQEAGKLNTLWEDARQKVLDGITTLEEASTLYQPY